MPIIEKINDSKRKIKQLYDSDSVLFEETLLVSNNIKLVFGEGGGYPITLGKDIYFTIQTEEVYINEKTKSNS